MEAHLKGGEGIAERAIPRRPEFAPAPLSFAQQRMWLMDQLQPGNPAYNRSTHIHLREALNIAVLENSVNEIVRRHEILRTSFLATDGQPVEGVLILATIAQNYFLRLGPGERVEPDPFITFRLSHRLRMTLEPRQP